MSLRQALSYPFQNGNLLKILPIAIIWSLLIYVTSYSPNVFIACGAVIAFMVLTVAISGYYISIIENVQLGSDKLQGLRLKTDTGRGCMSMIASLVYYIPTMIVGNILLFIAFSLGTVNDASNMVVGLGLMIIIIAGLVFLFITSITMMLATMVGFARYAAERTTNGLFAIGDNARLVWNNGGHSFGFFWRLFVIGFLNILVALVVGIAVGAVSFAFTNAAPDAPQNGLVFALTQVLSYTISLVFIVSIGHLIAQYGLALGLDARKRKTDAATDNSSNAVLLVFLLLIGIGILMAIAVIVWLTIMGPAVGNVFSDIVTGLEATPTFR